MPTPAGLGFHGIHTLTVGTEGYFLAHPFLKLSYIGISRVAASTGNVHPLTVNLTTVDMATVMAPVNLDTVWAALFHVSSCE